MYEYLSRSGFVRALAICAIAAACPQPAAPYPHELADAVENCNHWLGEPEYSAERAEEIRAHVASSCSWARELFARQAQRLEPAARAATRIVLSGPTEADCRLVAGWEDPRLLIAELAHATCGSLKWPSEAPSEPASPVSTETSF